MFTDHNRLIGPTANPKGTTNSSKQIIRTTPPPQQRNGSVISTGDIGLKTTSTQQQQQQQTNSNQIVSKTVCIKSPITNNNNQIQSVVDLNLIHANKGIEALGVLIQHLVFNVSTFIQSSSILYFHYLLYVDFVVVNQV